MHINLLLVEDDFDFAKLVTVWLSRAKKTTFNVSRAHSLQEALLLCEATSVDVILADLNLADSSGCETVNRLREKAPVTPIVVLSASGAEEVMYQTVVQGAQDFIVKPNCNAGRLISTILFAIARQYEAVTIEASRAQELQRA